MAKEYEATISSDEENPDLLRLTITGKEEDTTKPFPNLRRIINFNKIETMQEIREYQSVEDLRADINRERVFRFWERVGSIGVGSIGFASMWFINYNGPGVLSLASGALGLSTAIHIWYHSNDGLRKFNSALEEYKNTRFSVTGKLSTETPAQS